MEATVEAPRKKKSEFAKQPTEDKILLICCFTILGLFIVAIILPMVYIILASFVDPITLQNQGLTFDFSKWTLTAYERVMTNAQIWIGFRNALFYSVVSTALSVVITLLAAYPMSRVDFKGKGFFNLIFMITMFFGGGLIPTYLLISKYLGLMNNWLALILPGAISVYNMIIMRTYFMNSIPYELQEAAEIDGCTPMGTLLRVMLPLSGPVLAVIALYYGVGHWNSYFNALLYINNEKLAPLQLYLRKVLTLNNAQSLMTMGSDEMARQAMRAETIKYSVIVVSSIPMLIIYPFVQRFFVKGVRIGAVKG